MRGYVLVANEDGRRWLYIPEANIYLLATNVGKSGWVVAAFRTDGYYGKTRESAIPTTDHLRQAYQFTAEVEVPQEVIDFAVESERKRHESVDGIEEIFTNAFRPGGSREEAWREFQAYLQSESLEKADDPDEENRIGKEVNDIIERAGGLQ